MLTRTRVSIAGLVLLALVLTALNVPLASSQGVTISAERLAGDLPADDPDSDLWAEATAVEVPLSAQTVAPPKLLAASVRTVTVRAMHNDAQLALLLEWDDETRDDCVPRTQGVGAM